MRFIRQLASKFHERKYYGWQNSRWGNILHRLLKVFICVRRASTLYDSMMSIYRLDYYTVRFHALLAVQFLLHCWQWRTRRTTGELDRQKYLRTHLRASFHRNMDNIIHDRNGTKRLRVRSSITRWSSINKRGAYRIARNFREVQIFAIFATHDRNTKTKTAKILTAKIYKLCRENF